MDEFLGHLFRHITPDNGGATGKSVRVHGLAD